MAHGSPLLVANSIQVYLNRLEGIGVAGLLLVLIAAIGGSVLFTLWERFRWVTLGGVLFAAALTRPQKDQWYDRTLSPALQLFSDYARPLTFALLTMMFIGAVFVSRGGRRRLFSWPVLAFFGLQMLICIRFLASGAIERGVTTPYIYITILIGIVYGLGATMQSARGCRQAIWSIVWTATALIVATLFEYALRPDAVVSGGRLFAVMSNPQAAGSMFALSLVATFYLISATRGLTGGLLRPALFVVAGMMCLFVVWTGSRTALLATVVGLGVLYYDRLVLLPFVGGGLFLLVLALGSVYEDAISLSSRLLSTSDTRSEPWIKLIGDFVDNPVFGVPLTSGGSAENSYLALAAHMGFFGVIAALLLLAACSAMIYRLHRARGSLGKDARLANLAMSGIATILVISVFDAYLLGSMTVQVMIFYVYLSIGAALIEFAETRGATVMAAPPQQAAARLPVAM